MQAMSADLAARHPSVSMDKKARQPGRLDCIQEPLLDPLHALGRILPSKPTVHTELSHRMHRRSANTPESH